MKLKFFTLLLALSVFTTAQAQVDVTINPIGLLFGDFNVGADFVLTDNFSVEATVGFGTGGVSVGDIDTYKWTSIPVGVTGKYYFNPKNGADGFYADVFAKFINRSYGWDGDDLGYDADYSITRIGVGIGAGYKIVSKGGIVFDIGLGAGRALVSNTKFNDETQEEFITISDWTKLMIVGKLGIGYRFGG